jgi:hypothetical protein
MTTQIEINTRPCSLLNDLWRVYQQDLKGFRGDVRQGSRQIITAIVMRVIHPNHPDALSPTPHLEGVIDQHPDPHAFELWDLVRYIVVAQNTNDAQTSVDSPQNMFHGGINGLAWATRGKPVITGHDTKVNGQISNAIAHNFRKIREAIGMQVGQMQNTEPTETLGQVVIHKAQAADYGGQCVLLAAPSKPSQLQTHAEQRTQRPMVLRTPWTTTTFRPCLEQVAFDQATFAKKVFHWTVNPADMSN